MANIAIADVQAALVGFSISTTSTPSTAQVTAWIESVEAEVRAIVLAHGGEWPSTGETSTLALMVKETEVEGVKARLLSSLYSTSPRDMVPPSVDRSAQDYKDKLTRLREVASGMDSAAIDGAAVDSPVLAAVGQTFPSVSTSFFGYTFGRDIRDQVRRGLVWPRYEDMPW